MFFDLKVRMLGCGTQHVVVLTSAALDGNTTPVYDFTLPLPVAEPVSENEESKEPT